VLVILLSDSQHSSESPVKFYPLKKSTHLGLGVDANEIPKTINIMIMLFINILFFCFLVF